MSLYRLAIAVPPAYLRDVRAVFGPGAHDAILRDVTARLARMGAGALLFEPMQDPTAEDHLTAIARAVPTAPDDVVQVLSVEPVAAPARAPDASHPHVVRGLSELDPGLSTSELVAVGHALARETNPRHLAGFASTLEPHFPVAASRLRARSILAQGPSAHVTGSPDGPAFGAADVQRMRVGAVSRADAMGIPRELALGEVRRACCTYVAERPSLREPLPGLPPEISGLAAACIRPGALGTRLVDRDVLLSVSPPVGDEGYIAPSALQLAMFSGKPSVSRVWNQDAGAEVYRSLEETPTTLQGRIAQMRAKLSLEKAHKAIERGRWVRWYERRNA